MRYLLLLLVSCATPKTKGPLFLHQRIPEELCHGAIVDYGMYRLTKDGRTEEISYCDGSVVEYFGIHSIDLDLVD